ncbi:DNA primase [Patescibacteria group bacterium]|nr:DNA primase [Patescibacteria group bacterium]MBU1703295.1 DNA primase [Patescibacteria group bacterium]MBU1954024.1 DNA primase [Patescibacteria group bacterium]
MNPTQEIKDRLRIEDLVGQYVQLKKVGRSLKGLCPFHAEKTPSFIVSPERQIAYCFGCNKGGDIFSFIQEVEGIDFPDALKMLAEKTGIELEEYKSDRPKVTGDAKQQLFKVYEAAADFFERQLKDSEEGKKVMDYLHRRGLTDESIFKFRVGFSPDSFDATYTYLLKKGFTKSQLVSCGIAMTKETTVDKIYDRFRGRLMFPIRDNLGRIVAFGGRALKKDQDPKYVNSSESPIYHKSNVLYGFSDAKAAIKEKKEVIIAEGYFDVIAAHQVGAVNTVAPCGTALAASQLRLLNPFADTVILAFDNDIAGQEAANRAYELAQEFDMSVRMLVIPDGKDPADYVRDHGGGFNDLVKNAKPYAEFFYTRLFDVYGMDGIAAKKKILQEFLPFFGYMKSSIEKDEYVRRLALDLDLKEVKIYDEIKNYKLPDYHPARSHGSIDTSGGNNYVAKTPAEEIFLGLLIEFPRIGKLFLEKVDENYFSDDLKAIYKALVDQYNIDGFEAVKVVISDLPHEIREKAALISFYVSEKYGEISEMDTEKELKILTAGMSRKWLDQKKRDLQKRLYEAEKLQDKVLCDQLIKELNRLNTGVV